MPTPASVREHWDVVIIGARCAGATFATYLGRAGAKVLLVDRSPLPSDLVLSTHTLHPGGAVVLEELGLMSLGDAGVHKEFVTGDGMTEALLQARAAAAALPQGETALRSWGRRRDAAALPFYFFGKLQGAAGPPSALDALVLGRAARCPGMDQRFAESLTHQISPLEVVSLGQVLRWALPEVLRGRLGLLRDLWQRAALVAPMQRALAQASARCAT